MTPVWCPWGRQRDTSAVSWAASTWHRLGSQNGVGMTPAWCLGLRQHDARYHVDPSANRRFRDSPI